MALSSENYPGSHGSDGESTSDCIPTTIGVLQGDTLAPYLFVLVLDGLLRKLYQFPGIHGPHATTSHCDCVPVRFLAYADDIVLLAQNNKDLQGMFSALESNASVLGLQINYGLDKTATFASAGHVEIHTRDGKLIEQTSIYKYLGSFAALTPDKELSAKKGKAWAQIKAYDFILRSTVHPDLKRQLFQALVEPILSFGSTSFRFLRSFCRELDAFYGRLLRYALGLPPAYVSHSY